jgi:hypothetical protein
MACENRRAYVRARILACSALALGCMVAALPAICFAQARTALSWVRQPGAEACIAAPELGHRVEQMIGPVLAAAPGAEVSIEGHVAPEHPGFAARVVVTDAAGLVLGRRELRTERADCRALDESIVFVIAVAIDPDAALALLPGELSDDGDPGQELLAELAALASRPAPPSRAAAFAARVAAPPAVPAPEVGGPGLRVSVGPGFGVGFLDAPAVGASAAAALVFGRVAYRVRGLGFWTQSAAIDAERGVALGLFQLDAAVCPQLWSGGRWGLSLCAGVAAARFSTEPQGFSGTARARWLFGPGAGLGLARALGAGLFLVLQAEAQALWPRHRVVVEAAGQPQLVHRIAPGMLAGGLALELRF